MEKDQQTIKTCIDEIHVLPENGHFLKPGEYYCGDTKKKVTTILGPCVSVIFYIKKLTCMAICHGMMP